MRVDWDNAISAQIPITFHPTTDGVMKVIGKATMEDGQLHLTVADPTIIDLMSSDEAAWSLSFNVEKAERTVE